MDPVQMCVLPAVASTIFSLCCALAALGAPERKWRLVVLGISGAALGAFLFFRLLEINPVISGIMLLVGAVPAIVVLFVPRSISLRRFLPSRLSAAYGLLCVGFLFVMLPARMVDEADSVALSPDGRYNAVLSYYDGLTFGYERIRLEDRSLHSLLVPDEVSEADESGLDGIAWRDQRTLIITYSCPDSELVVRESRWRDVRIVYQKTLSPAGDASGSAPQASPAAGGQEAKQPKG